MNIHETETQVQALNPAAKAWLERFVEITYDDDAWSGYPDNPPAIAECVQRGLIERYGRGGGGLRLSEAANQVVSEKGYLVRV